jgi:DNA repair exonuclease SbcCD nuclease subunit
LYRGLFIADIHIGAMSIEQTEKECEYLHSLLKQYTREGLLDFIIIGGDYFDKQMYSSDLYIPIAQKLMIWLLTASKVVRVVYGTSSHDSSQYSIFDSLVSELPKSMDILKFDFRVIYNVTEEELLPGMKVLYIPEEYIYDKHEYYKEFLSEKNKYDFIFGHGMIQEAFTGKIKESKKEDTSRKKAPMFKAGELAYACRGEVIFGHYHIHAEYDDNVSYSGSFSRWKQGEDEDKGFFQLSFDPEDKKCTKDFIVNAEALIYHTLKYGNNHPVYNDSDEWNKTVYNIKKLKLQKNIYKLKVIFSIPDGYENEEAFISFFREAFKNENNIAVEFSHTSLEKKMNLTSKRVATLPPEYKVFIDKNVPEEVKISLFLKMKKDIDIPAEVIRETLDE